MSDVRILMHKKSGPDWVPVTDDDLSPADFANILNKPTTVAGYGITDAAKLNAINTFEVLQNFTSISASSSVSGNSLISLTTVSCGAGSTGLVPYTGALLLFNGASVNPIAVSAEVTTDLRNITLPDKDGQILVGSILSANVDDSSDMPYTTTLVKWGSKLLVSLFLDDAITANGTYTIQNDLYNGRQYWLHDSEANTFVRWDGAQWEVVVDIFGTVATGFYQDVVSPEYVTSWVTVDIDYGDCLIKKLSFAGNSIPNIQGKVFCLTDNPYGYTDTLTNVTSASFADNATFSYSNATAKTNHLTALGVTAEGTSLITETGAFNSRRIDDIGFFRSFSSWSGDSANGGAATVLTEIGANSGTSATGYARVVVGRNLTAFTGLSGGYKIDCAKGITISCLIGVSIASGSTGCARLVVGVANSGTPQTAAQNALTARGWGVEFKENSGIHQYRLFAHNGTTYVTGTWINFASGQQYPMKIEKAAGSSIIYLYTATTANGSFPTVATTSLVGAPTSGASGDGNVCLIATNNGSSGTVAVDAKMFPDIKYRIY